MFYVAQPPAPHGPIFFDGPFVHRENAQAWADQLNTEAVVVPAWLVEHLAADTRPQGHPVTPPDEVEAARNAARRFRHSSS